MGRYHCDFVPIICKKCGKPLHANSTFCTSCGEKTELGLKEMQKIKINQKMSAFCCILSIIFLILIIFSFWEFLL